MKLRYIVEGKFSATFTASKNVKTKEDAYKIAISLGLLNLKAGYMKYSNAILYDDLNNKLESITIKQ